MQHLILIQHLTHDYLLSLSERDVIVQNTEQKKLVCLKKKNKYLKALGNKLLGNMSLKGSHVATAPNTHIKGSPK